MNYMNYILFSLGIGIICASAIEQNVFYLLAGCSHVILALVWGEDEDDTEKPKRVDTEKPKRVEDGFFVSPVYLNGLYNPARFGIDSCMHCGAPLYGHSVCLKCGAMD